MDLVGFGTPLDYRNTLDTAIVGAGCAGLYCAWRLKEQDRSTLIAVFEADDRVGGRLLSVDLPPPKSSRPSRPLRRSQRIGKAELGGMRFTSSQLLVDNTLRTLMARRRDHYEEALHRRPFSFERQFMYLRNAHIDCASASTEAQAVYPGVRNNDPFEVLKSAVQMALSEATFAPDYESEGSQIKRALGAGVFSKRSLSLEQWRFLQRHGSLDGRPLYDLGFWNVLQHYLKPNEFLFIRDSLGYESLVANWNLAQAIPVVLSDFDRPRYYTLNGGLVSLPRALAIEFERQEPALDGIPGILALQHQLVSVRRLADSRTSRFRITVKKVGPNDNGRLLDYEAKRLILALPKAALNGIEFIGFGEDHLDRFRRLCDDVTGHRAFKLFLAFERTWWRDKRLCRASVDATSRFPRGRATTDFPIRQIYYNGQCEDGPATIMASYSDDHNVDFWDPLVNDPHKHHYLYPLPYEGVLSAVGEPLDRYRASRALVRKALRQLARIHGIVDEADNPDEDRIWREGKLYAAIVKEWKDAWHFWNVHTQPWVAIEEMAQPFGDAELYVCGEAYSMEQGWVEGALKSAELALACMNVAEPRFKASTKAPNNFQEYIRS